jgi:hypothetical protein
MIIKPTFPVFHLVTPAKAGVHHRRPKFHQQVMDSRLRGNDDIMELNRDDLSGGVTQCHF